MDTLAAENVVPGLRGRFGRPYLYVETCPSTQRLFALSRDLGRETGADAGRAQSTAARLAAATDAFAGALRGLVPPARPGVDESRAPVPSERLESTPALARYQLISMCCLARHHRLEYPRRPNRGR